MTSDSYQSGKRAKALKRMSGKPFCNSLEEAARNYRTKKGKEQKLLELIREGMALITPESPNLTDYLYDWAYEEERDFYPVGMESQVMLGYSTRDTLHGRVYEFGLPGDLCPYPGHIQVPDTGNGLSLPNERLPGKAFKMAGTFYKTYS